MQIIQASSPNYSAGRNGKKIIAIVNHITAGLMPGTLSWLQNPAAKASAHYLVTKTGIIYQLVSDDNTAWHAGAVNKPNWSLYDGSNPNRYTIGIEHECLSGEELTEKQYQATLWLQKQLAQNHSIPIDTDHIIGHYRIDSVNRPNCPGPKFPWDRLFTDLKGQSTITQVTIIAGSTSIVGQLNNDKTWGPIAAICKAKNIAYSWDGSKRVMALAGVDISNIPATTGVTIAAGNQAIAGSIIDNSTWGPVAAICKALSIPYSWDTPTMTMKF